MPSRHKVTCNSLYRFVPVFRILISVLISLFVSFGSPQAAVQLVDRIRILAEQGDREAQFSMGLRYDLGDGVERNPELAAQWFTKAATPGVAGACLYLGMKYDFGTGVRQDKAAAIRWYEQAAVQHWPQAAFLLGSLYLTLATPDPVQGCSWIIIAEEQRYPGAEQTRLQQCAELEKDVSRQVEGFSSRLRQRIRDSKE